MYLHDYNCIATCPEGYRANSTSMICVNNETRCDYGYELNQQGECVVKKVECPYSNILDNTGSICIPQAGFYVPFPFTIVGLLSFTSAVIFKMVKKSRISLLSVAILCSSTLLTLLVIL